ncbi:unnamed protein product [Penicillium glandicola]
MAPHYRNDQFSSSRRPFPSRNDRDGRMYDDRSRSRSPGSSTPETEKLDKATEAMIEMIILVALRTHHRIGAGARTKTVTERVTEVRAAIQAEVAALVEASPIRDRRPEK